MKKIFLIAAAAAMVLSSCSKNTVSEDTSDVNAIGFGTYSGRATKSDPNLIATGTTLTKGTSFGVYGYLSTDGSTWAATLKPGFMPNQLVDYKSDGTYDYTPARYWPKDETKNKISFYGYYPYSDGTLHGIVPSNLAGGFTAGLGTYAFTVQPTPETQVDFMVSDLEKDLVYSNAKLNTSSSADGRVNLTFHHMLTKVGIDVKTDADDKTEVYIESITFTKLKNNATLTANVDATTNGWAFPTPATTADYSLPVIKTQRITSTAADVCKTTANPHAGDLLMIPQDLTSDNTIVVKYNYTTTGSEKVSDTATITIPTATLTKWEMNKYVMYHLTIGMRKITFEANVIDWVNSTVNPDINVLP
jgi:predicted small secreted protein